MMSRDSEREGEEGGSSCMVSQKVRSRKRTRTAGSQGKAG